MPKKQYLAFTDINTDNFAVVKKNYANLVFHWLSKSSVPIKKWDWMQRQFWEQVWIDRTKFDSKRGRMTTWLGWEWKKFTQQLRRSLRAGYDEAVLTENTHKSMVLRQIPVQTRGLEPQRPPTIDVQNFTKEKQRSEMQALFQTPYEPLEGQIGLRQLVSTLSQEQQSLIAMLNEGIHYLEIAEAFNVSDQTVRNRVRAIQQELMALMNGSAPKKPPVFLVVVPDSYWEWWFKTTREALPVRNVTQQEWALMCRSR